MGVFRNGPTKMGVVSLSDLGPEEGPGRTRCTPWQPCCSKSVNGCSYFCVELVSSLMEGCDQQLIGSRDDPRELELWVGIEDV